jgi:pyruvate dehydrogenase E2 component (dihydrolipoamide acetyltransferase)
MHEFKMPSLGSSMEDGTVIDWKVEPGDTVERGDIVCEVETQKGDIDVEIWESGEIAEILVEPGRKVPVGEVLALIKTGDEAEVEPAGTAVEAESAKEAEAEQMPGYPQPAAQAAGDEPAATPAAVERSERPTLPLPTSSKRGINRVMASPAARRRAAELGIDITRVQGTGADGAISLDDVESFNPGEAPASERRAAPAVPEHHVRVTPMARKLAEELGVDVEALDGTGDHGAVTKADVRRAAPQSATGVESAPTKAVAEDDKYAQLREAIAKAMERSKREIPHYYLEEAVDMHAARDWLSQRNAERPPTERVLMPVLVARAVAKAATQFPEMNGFFEDGAFAPSDRVHLGFAVAMRGGGVVAPAVHDFADRALDEVMADVRDLVRRVRGGKLRSSELSDPTITVTNLGEQGVDKVYGVIYPPQVAIVGVGKISQRPWARQDMVGVHPVATLTLSADHRVSDGITGAKFLKTIAELLQEPESFV